MRRLSNATRISIGLTLVTLSVIAGAYALELVPRRAALESQSRLKLSQNMAIQFSVALVNDDPDEMLRLAESVMGHAESIRSMAVRRADESLLFASAEHEAQWRDTDSGQHVEVPLYDDRGQYWGTVEILFTPLPTALLSEWALLAFVGGGCLLAYMLYMRRTLRALDPSQVVPARVKAALDTLAEGALVIDRSDRIMLANHALGEILDRDPAAMLGTKASELDWLDAEHDRAPQSLPWDHAEADSVFRGVSLRLRTPAGPRTLMVNATPILGAGNHIRGMLVTFDDVTSIEEKNQQLVEMVHRLGEAQERVNRQNEELTRLATRDALTGCLNRRAFHEQLTTLFEIARRREEPFAALMVDVDHFKSINDNHGHATGDEVLRGLGKRLQAVARKSDVVCRYGGEEFCVLMPNTSADGAAVLGEKIRHALAGEPLAGLTVTASLGVAETDDDVANAEQLIDHADAALYAAKQSGRDRVVRYDQRPEGSAEPTSRPEPVAATDHVPIHAVTALFAALRYRDPMTAEHSHRVADLCVRFAVGTMSPRDLFILEVAALLHDIGKIGVPDAILLKPGRLTEDEWEVMNRHDRIGLEILQCFDCREVVAIVRHHHSYFQDSTYDASEGHNVPLRARILSIADAYDAMVSDRVYRPARSREQAFAELRRCAGTQFDPELVERFIAVIERQGDQVAANSQIEFDLRIGLEVERLSGALLRKDVPSIGVLAERLRATATSLGRTEIATIAKRVEDAVEIDLDLDKLLNEVNALLELCAQSASTNSNIESPPCAHPAL
ncbi:MAG: diguanylate cyclase [Planctomycetota bacterium]